MTTAGRSGPVPAASPDAGSPSQQARRRRILSAAIDLARGGGYDAVQMREVAEKAEVALGTLYRYFPSKVHLLVTAMGEQFEAVRDRVAEADRRGGDEVERALEVFGRVNEVLARDPLLSGALVRAAMLADTSVVAEVDRVSAILTSIITWATHGDAEPPSERDAVVSGIIGKVWLLDIVWWLTDRMTLEEMQDDLASTLRLLLR